VPATGRDTPPAQGWTAAATTHPNDRAGLDTDVAFRIASVTKMMTATALLVLADQGHCRLDDPTGRHLPSDLVDRFRDSRGRAYAAAVTLRQLLDHTSGLPNFFTQPPVLEAVRHGAGRRRFTPADLVDLGAAVARPWRVRVSIAHRGKNAAVDLVQVASAPAQRVHAPQTRAVTFVSPALEPRGPNAYQAPWHREFGKRWSRGAPPDR
jgi:CubicO group peptidase (beta-lactamase class C family)